MLGLLTQESLILILLVSGVPLIASSLTAGTLAVLQAVTQIQEQTIVHLLRIIVCLVALYCISPYALQLFDSLLTSVFLCIETVGRGGM
jgi:flagellar biosynthesis protein FliQ